MKNNNQNLKTFRKKLRIIKKFYILLLVILLPIIAGRITGCSEDPTSTTPPPPPASSEIGTLTVTPDILIASVSDTIIARFKANSGIFFSDSLATLIKVDNNGNEVSVYGQLLDNGNLSNGDEISRDNIYSGRFIINETTVGDLKMKAKGNVNENGNVTSKSTSAFTVHVYSQLNSGEVSTVLTTQNNATNQLVTYLGGNPNNIAAASNQLKTWLETQPGVQSVEKDNNTALIINYSSGLTGGMIFSVNETRGGIETDTLQRRSIREIPADRQTIGENFYEQKGISVNTSDNILFDANAVGNRNVLIYAPYEAVWTNNERPLIKARLQAAQCKDYQITEYVNQAATVTALMDMTQYGMIFFATHGSKGKAILTGEIVDTNSNLYKDTYKALYQAKRISIFRNIKISNAGGVERKEDVWAITNLFVSNLTGTCPTSVIVNNTCSSTENPDLYTAFFGKGAKTYYGHDKTVNGAFAKMIADSLAKRLAVTGLTTGQAYFAASDPIAPNANFQLAPGGNNDLKFKNSLLNSDFEEGTIVGWTKVGDGRVINRLGTLNASQGNFMGIISTGLGFTTSSGSISQCLTIENNQSLMTVNYNFLSEEFLEYIHSQFQDYFKIILKKQDGTEVTLFSKNIDQIAVEFGADTNMAGQLIRVSPNIVFDRGDVYMTNWQTKSFDVTPYRGQTVVIVFICGDVGDSIYDTAILLDAIKVN